MKKRNTIWLLGLFFAGCSGISVEVTAEDADAEIEVDFSGECTGDGTETTPLGVVRHQKSNAANNCQVHVDWVGNLVDMGVIKEDIKESAGDRDVTIEEIDVFLKVVEMRDVTGAVVAVPDLESFSGSVSIAGIPLYELTGSSFETLVGPDGLTVTRTDRDTDPILKEINGALAAGAQLEATADADLTTTSTMPLQQNNKHRIVFSHRLDIRAKAGLF